MRTALWRRCWVNRSSTLWTKRRRTRSMTFLNLLVSSTTKTINWSRLTPTLWTVRSTAAVSTTLIAGQEVSTRDNCTLTLSTASFNTKVRWSNSLIKLRNGKKECGLPFTTSIGLEPKTVSKEALRRYNNSLTSIRMCINWSWWKVLRQKSNSRTCALRTKSFRSSYHVPTSFRTGSRCLSHVQRCPRTEAWSRVPLDTFAH